MQNPASLLPPRPDFLAVPEAASYRAALGLTSLLPHAPRQYEQLLREKQSFSDGGRVLGALHKVTVRFFHTWSRLSPVDGGPYGERDGLSEVGVVLESGAHGARQVGDRKNERNSDSGSIGNAVFAPAFKNIHTFY